MIATAIQHKKLKNSIAFSSSERLPIMPSTGYAPPRSVPGAGLASD